MKTSRQANKNMTMFSLLQTFTVHSSSLLLNLLFCPSSPLLCLPLQAATWNYHKKRYPPSHGSNGKPRSRVHHVQLIRSFQDGWGGGGDDCEEEEEEEEEEVEEEEVGLLDSSKL